MSEDKSLADKAVNIKGRQYVLVQDRVLYFNENYPEGSIVTDAQFFPELKMWKVKATVYPNVATPAGYNRSFSGYSQAVIGQGMVNQTAALENAETSAVGRALAFMGIGVIESIASADEVVKATNAPIAAKTAPLRTEGENRVLAAKERIVNNLRRLGKPNGTKEEVQQSVFDTLGVELTPDKYEWIGEELGKLSDKKK